MSKSGKPTNANTPTPQSKALAKAILDSGKSHEDIASVLKVTPGLVSAWVTARKPVPATRARPLAEELGNVAPEAISKAYATISHQGGGSVVALPGSPVLRPELALSRIENDIDSLRWFANVLVGVMIRHRPAEAGDVLNTIQRTVPRKFRDSGFLLELTEALAPKAGGSAKARGAARRRAKPPSS